MKIKGNQQRQGFGKHYTTLTTNELRSITEPHDKRSQLFAKRSRRGPATILPDYAGWVTVKVGARCGLLSRVNFGEKF